jgi:membrane-associated phospholipid phosphatase
VLTEITGAIIIAGWVAYNYMTIHETHGKERQFLSFVGWTLPVAYFLKVILQDAFGRVNPRNWLFDQNLHGTMWFNRYDDYGHCFPSGHMTVFTALFAALWHFYPRGRLLYIVSLSFLGAALVVTDYHYLSDVIAGAYLGYAVVGWSYRTHWAGTMLLN